MVTRFGSFPLNFIPVAGTLHGPVLYLLSDTGELHLISWAAKDTVASWNLKRYRPKHCGAAQVCVATALNLIFVRWENVVVILQQCGTVVAVGKLESDSFIGVRETEKEVFIF